MFSAWGRFSGVAWGSVESQDDVMRGFAIVDVSDMQTSPSSTFVAWEGRDLPSDDDDPEEDALLPLPEVNVAALSLPENNATEDFGPLPKYLSDYESIVLSVQDDGTKLPDDSMEDLSNIELPHADVQLAGVGAGWKEHIVKAGETLSDIALTYGGVTAQDILRANGLKDANRLAADQLLLIPNDSSRVEDTLDEVRVRQMRVAVLKEKVEPLKVSAYVVVQGDSLWSISNSQNIELDTLVGSNTFKSSATLHPGAVLRIPNQDGIFYILKKGEKIEAVCKRYGVDMKRLRQVNHTVDIVSLKEGDEIFLPDARPEALTEPRQEEAVNKKLASKPAPAAAKKTPAAPVSRKTAAPAKGGSRSYRWPLMGRINSPFGWRQHPITKRRDFHTGIDIKANRGAAIRGARGGKVVYSGWMGGYGKVLVVEHADGQSTLYAHCSALLVGQGAKVSQGQNIAQVGTTGRTTGPHLHFEVRKGNSPVNPLQYLK